MGTNYIRVSNSRSDESTNQLLYYAVITKCLPWKCEKNVWCWNL